VAAIAPVRHAGFSSLRGWRIFPPNRRMKRGLLEANDLLEPAGPAELSMSAKRRERFGKDSLTNFF